MESKVIARFARISPRKARVVVNLVRGQKVAEALDMLAYTRKSGAPVIKKLIEAALANAKQKSTSVDVDALYVSAGAVDKGPNKHNRRWRPRAMGRATQITKGISHIQITLTDTAPASTKKARRGGAAAKSTETSTTATAE